MGRFEDWVLLKGWIKGAQGSHTHTQRHTHTHASDDHHQYIYSGDSGLDQTVVTTHQM